MLRRQRIAMVAALVITVATTAWALNRELTRTEEPIQGLRRDSRIAACLNPSGGPVSGGLPSVELPCMGAAGPATITLSSYAEAKPMLISLWASYCQYCRQELQAIDAFRQQQRNGVHVLTVLTADNETSAQLMIDVAPDLPVSFDREGQLLDKLRVAKALPVVVVVRPGGTVAKTYQGTPLTSVDQVSELGRVFKGSQPLE
ncbi:TlpA disulfide reductase family protein [Micromonospora tulbaghiae]|nr:TlpA disulfide reductase family protein [Micromonospora tulbaghiae]